MFSALYDIARVDRTKMVELSIMKNFRPIPLVFER